MSVEHYSIKELAEAKGTSAPVRAALVAEIVAWLRDNSTPHNDIDE